MAESFEVDFQFILRSSGLVVRKTDKRTYVYLPITFLAYLFKWVVDFTCQDVVLFQRRSLSLHSQNTLGVMLRLCMSLHTSFPCTDPALAGAYCLYIRRRVPAALNAQRSLLGARCRSVKVQTTLLQPHLFFYPRCSYAIGVVRGDIWKLEDVKILSENCVWGRWLEVGIWVWDCGPNSIKSHVIRGQENTVFQAQGCSFLLHFFVLYSPVHILWEFEQIMVFPPVARIRWLMTTNSFADGRMSIVTKKFSMKIGDNYQQKSKKVDAGSYIHYFLASLSCLTFTPRPGCGKQGCLLWCLPKYHAPL